MFVSSSRSRGTRRGPVRHPAVTFQGQRALGATEPLAKERPHRPAKLGTGRRGFPAPKFCPSCPLARPGVENPSRPRPRATVPWLPLALGPARAAGTTSRPCWFGTPHRHLHRDVPVAGSPAFVPIRSEGSRSIKLAAEFARTGTQVLPEIPPSWDHEAACSSPQTLRGRNYPKFPASEPKSLPAQPALG